MNYYKINHDPFNKRGSRNIRNTDKADYNCGGYALGTFSWYLPSRTRKEYSDIMGYADIGDMDVALTLASEAIVNELPGWTTVPFALVMERKYSPKAYEVVAMRFCYYDFHFWKLGRNWNWYDKMGCREQINRHAFNDARNVWNDRYDSPVVCFIRARK